MLNKDKVFFALRFTISFGLLLTLLWIMRDAIGDIRDILKNSNMVFFMLAVLMSVPITFFMSLRLKQLMLGHKISLPLKDFVYLTFIGYFFNNFLPTAIGGDVVKAYYASKKTNKTTASYAAVLTDRLCGMAGLLIIALTGLLLLGDTLGNKKVVWAVVAMAILLISSMVFLLYKKSERSKTISAGLGIINVLLRKILKLHDAINLYRHHPGLLTKAVLITLVGQGISILCIYLFIVSLGGEINFIKLFLIVPLVWTISMLPSLNGLGVREGAFVYFLKGDLGSEMAFTISLLWLGIIILYGVTGGLLHLLYPLKVKNNIRTLS